MNGIIERMLENAQEHGCLNEVVKSAIEIAQKILTMIWNRYVCQHNLKTTFINHKII